VKTLLKVEFDEADNLQCTMVLAAVSASMRSRLPSLDTWIADGSTDPVLATFCAVAMTKECIDVVDVGNVKSEQHPEHTIVFRDVTDGAELDVPESWIDRLTPHQLRSSGRRPISIRPGSG
jgi:hypothetical protein